MWVTCYCYIQHCNDYQLVWTLNTIVSLYFARCQHIHHILGRSHRVRSACVPSTAQDATAERLCRWRGRVVVRAQASDWLVTRTLRTYKHGLSQLERERHYFGNQEYQITWLPASCAPGKLRHYKYSHISHICTATPPPSWKKTLVRSTSATRSLWAATWPASARLCSPCLRPVRMKNTGGDRSRNTCRMHPCKPQRLSRRRSFLNSDAPSSNQAYILHSLSPRSNCQQWTLNSQSQSRYRSSCVIMMSFFQQTISVLTVTHWERENSDSLVSDARRLAILLNFNDKKDVLTSQLSDSLISSWGW